MSATRIGLTKDPEILKMNIKSLCDTINDLAHRRALEVYRRDTSIQLTVDVEDATSIVYVAMEGEWERHQDEIDELDKQLEQARRTLIHRQEEIKELKHEQIH